MVESESYLFPSNLVCFGEVPWQERSYFLMLFKYGAIMKEFLFLDTATLIW